jgi:hypothetical protein
LEQPLGAWNLLDARGLPTSNNRHVQYIRGQGEDPWPVINYLHLRSFEGDMLKDEEGSEFASLAAARKEAIFVMQDFVAAAIRQGDEPPFEAIVLADEHGAHLAAVPLIAALPSTIVGLVKHPEKVIPADRFEEYRRHADECRRKARQNLTSIIGPFSATLTLEDNVLARSEGHAPAP